MQPQTAAISFGLSFFSFFNSVPFFLVKILSNPAITAGNMNSMINVEHNVPFELHIFPDGHHGLGLAKFYKDISKWPDLSVEWIQNNF